jgi:hypothetical protein
MSVHGKDVAQDLVQPVAGGIERDRLAQQCLRLPWIAVQQHRVDLVQPALGRLGIGGGGAAVGYCRVFGVALGLEQVGEAPMAVGHHGCQLETGGCLSEAAAAQQCQAERAVRSGIRRVEPGRLAPCGNGGRQFPGPEQAGSLPTKAFRRLGLPPSRNRAPGAAGVSCVSRSWPIEAGCTV